jgi:hypothetical protein
VDTAWSFNLSRRLLDKIRVKLNASTAMGSAGHRKAQQNEQVAERVPAVYCENATDILLVGLPAVFLLIVVAYGFTKETKCFRYR